MDDNGKRDLILHGNMARVILTLAGPIMLGNFIQTMYNLADTYFVSQIGDTHLADYISDDVYRDGGRYCRNCVNFSIRWISSNERSQ